MRTKILLISLLALFTLIFSALMYGAGTGAVTPALAEKPAAQAAVACERDVVQADDSLSKLAAKFYGDSLAYPVIFEATNVAAQADSTYATLADPYVIEVGQKLCIPSAADAQAMMGGGMAAGAAAPAAAPSALPIGDPAIAEAEASCAAAKANAPWYGTLAPGFNHDSERTGTFECAQFPGSMTGPNAVQALKTSPGYVTPFSTVTRNPEDVYWYAGCTGDATPPQFQTYIAKVEPVTMKEIWRTNLSGVGDDNQLHACGAPWAMADGSVLATSDHTLYKLDGDTGEIIAQLDYPTGAAAPIDAAANGSDSFPDGTIIVKTMNRPAGCTKNGLSSVFVTCPGGVNAGAPSVLSAINPDTFQVIDSLVLAGNFPSRVTTTVFQGHNHIYLVNLSGQLLRWEWDGQKITPDDTFGTPGYLLTPGQTGGGAPTVMGDWVILNTNGVPVTTTMSIVAISQADPTKVTGIELTPNMEPGEISTSAAKPTVDPDNQRIYMADYGTGVVSAIQMSDGKLSILWQAEQRTNGFTSLIGPADQRVYVATNITATFPITNPLNQLVPGPDGANYTEQVMWRDAATGKLLAASDFYSPAAPGSQIPPGYGGIIYDLLYNGDVVAMYVQPSRRR